MDPFLGFVGLALLALLASIFTALEVALASLGRVRLTALLKEQPQHRRLIQVLLDRPHLVVNAMALLTDATLALTGILAAMLAFALFPDGTAWAKGGIAFLIAAGYLIVLGELVPKYLGRELIGGWLLELLRPLYWFLRPLFPVVRASRWAHRGLRKVLRLEAHGEDKLPPVSEDQIKFLLEYLLDEAEEHGLVEEEEERMIWRILTYDDLMVRQVMVPRPEVVSISTETPLREVHEIIAREGHSRYPVYEGARDNIIGILHAKDLLRIPNGDDRPLRDYNELIRPPFFTPTIKPINDLLRAFQRNKKHMAIVVDEFGSTAGIVTLEDILEEIVGEISDEYDQPRQMIRRLSPREYLIEGDAELSLINEELGLELPIDGAVTIGGFVTQRLEEIPRPGRAIKTDGITIIVESATAREVLKVRLKLPESAPSAPQTPVGQGR